MKKCPYCLEKEKYWEKEFQGSSEIQCAFPNWESFNTENWNCWLLDIIREIAEKNYIYNDDIYTSIIPYSDWNLYVSWYKNRWQTLELFDTFSWYYDNKNKTFVFEVLSYEKAFKIAKELEQNKKN